MAHRLAGERLSSAHDQHRPRKRVTPPADLPLAVQQSAYPGAWSLLRFRVPRQRRAASFYRRRLPGNTFA